MEINIQEQIQNLEHQLQAKREELSRQHGSGEISELPEEKATLHEIVGERIGEVPSVSPSVQIPTDDTQMQTIPAPTIDPPSYLSEDLKSQVQELVNMTFEKGLDTAIERAKATKNAALIDAFHDAVVDELFAHLVERGKLKEF